MLCKKFSSHNVQVIVRHGRGLTPGTYSMKMDKTFGSSWLP